MSILFNKIKKLQNGGNLTYVYDEVTGTRVLKNNGNQVSPESQHRSVAALNASRDPRFTESAGIIANTIGSPALNSQMTYVSDDKFAKYLNSGASAKSYNKDLPIGYLQSTQNERYPITTGQYMRLRNDIPNVLGGGINKFNNLGVYYDNPKRYGNNKVLDYGDNEQVKFDNLSTGGNYVQQ